MSGRRLSAKFWFGLVAGTGLGIFLTCWFFGNWWNQVPAYEVIFFAKILAWFLLLGGVVAALFVGGRRTG